MENGSIVDDGLDDSFCVVSYSSGGDDDDDDDNHIDTDKFTNNNSSSSRSDDDDNDDDVNVESSSSNSENDRNRLNRHSRVRYRRRRQRSSHGDGSDRRHFAKFIKISNFGSFVLCDSDDLIVECRNQSVCANHKINMDCVRLKRSQSSDTSIASSAHIKRNSTTVKSEQSFFRRGYRAIRNSLNPRKSRRFRYMKSVSLSIAGRPSADRNNNRNGNAVRMWRDSDWRNNYSSDWSPYRPRTYVRRFFTSVDCIDTNDDDDSAMEQTR